MTEKTARLAVEIDSRPAKTGASEVSKELDRLKGSARGVQGELDRLGKGGGSSLSALGLSTTAAGKGFKTVADYAADAARSVASADASNKAAARSAVDLAAAEARSAQAMAAAERATAANRDELGRFVASQKSAQETSNGVEASLKRIIAIVGLSKLAREALSMADAYKNVQGRLTNVTSGYQELTTVTAALFAIAQRSRAEFEGTADLYSSLARSTKTLGTSQRDLLQVTETINKALIVSGASSETAKGALVQLGQGFASGALRGDELNSVLEGTPRLAQAIADGMGVTVGQLRALGGEGKITGKAVFDALKTQRAAVEREFAQMPITISQSLTVVKNELLKFVGETDGAGGFTTLLSSGIESLGRNVDTIIPLVTGLGVALGVGFVVRAAAATVAASAATTALGAMGLVGQAAGTSLLSAFGGPLGIALTAVAFAIGGVAASIIDANQKAADADRVYDDLGRQLTKLGIAADGASTSARGVGTGALGAVAGVNAMEAASFVLGTTLYRQANAAKQARIETAAAQVDAAKKALADSYDALPENRYKGAKRGNLLGTAQSLGSGFIKDLTNVVTGGESDATIVATQNRNIENLSRASKVLEATMKSANVDVVQPKTGPTAAELKKAAREAAAEAKRTASETERRAKAEATASDELDKYLDGLGRAVEVSKELRDLAIAEAHVRELAGRAGYSKDRTEGAVLESQLLVGIKANQQFVEALDRQNLSIASRAKVTDDLPLDSDGYLDSPAQRERKRVNDELNKDAARREVDQKRLSDQFYTLFSGGIKSLARDFYNQLHSAAADGLGKIVDNLASGRKLGDGVGVEDYAAIGTELGLKAADAFGLKSSKIGGTIGGTIGSAIGGPLGKAVGTVLGSIAGGLFKKTPKASVELTTGDFGQVTQGVVDGSKKLSAAVSAMGNAFAAALAQISDGLNGSIVAGVSLGTIGQKGKKFTFDADGAGGRKATKYDTEQEAQEAAIRYALSSGAVSGLRAGTRNLALGSGDLTTQLNKASQFENVFKELKAATDPVGAAIDDLDKQFTDLKGIFQEAGASTQDYADLERLYQIKRLDIINQGNTTALKSMKDYLFSLQTGTATGQSADVRYASASAQLAALNADRASGKTVDFDNYKTISDSFLSSSRDLFGSTTAYFNDVNSITGTLKTMIEASEAAATSKDANATVVTAIDNQTSQTVPVLENIQAILAAMQAANDGTGRTVSTGTGAAVSNGTSGARYYQAF